MSNEISLIITNTVTFVQGRLKSEVYQGLKRALGYMPEDALYRIQQIQLDPDIENKPWLKEYDGLVTTVCYNSAKCKCAVKKQGTHFPTGLASKAIAYFKSQYMTCKVYDKREKVCKSLNLIMDTGEFEDRDYQTDAINKACNVERGVLQAATGSGKSFIGASIIAKLNVSPFVFYVTSKDLLNQAKDELERFINYNGSSLDVGVIGDGKCNIKDINVMTIQTAVRACGMKYKKFDDEEKIVKEKGVSEKNKIEIKDLILSAKGMIVDECVTGDTLVHTEQGKVRIDEIESRNCKLILSYNGQKPIWSEITDFFRMGNKEIIEIELESCRRIKCTKNHPLMTDSGWKKAGKITKKDKILGLVSAAADKFYQDVQGKDIYLDTKLKKEQIRNGKRYIRILSGMPRFACADAERELSLEQQLLRYLFKEKGRGATVNFANSMIRDLPIGISDLINSKNSLFLELCLEIHQYFAGIIAWIKEIGLNIKCLFCTDFIHILKKLKIKAMETGLYITTLEVIHLCSKFMKSLIMAPKESALLGNGSIPLGPLDLHGGSAMMEATLRNLDYTQRDFLWKRMKSFPNGFQITTDQFQFTEKSKNTILLEFCQKQEERFLKLSKNTSLHACNTKYQKIVSIKEVASEDVYDITVKETHCFFANDILVHNCQHVRSDSCQVISDMSLGCRYRYGMSVFSDTKIEIKGDMFFERGENITIEEAWKRASLGNYSLRCDGGYDVIDLSGAESRGWEKESFRWKGVRRIIRHKNTSTSYMVRFAGKDNIKLTEDHSIFKITDSGEIIQCLTSDLEVGDTLLLDNGAGYSDKAESIDILSSLPSNKFRVGINLKGIPLSEIGLNKHSYSQLCRRGVMSKKYGGSLYLSQYRDNLEVFQKHGITPKWIYTEGANGVGLSTSVSLNNFSYIIGFFLGDGWFDGSRIRFAVEESFLDTFLNKLQSIEGLVIHPKCKKMKGASFEVSISCFPLVTFLKKIVGEYRCYDKRIPKELLFGDEESRRMLLEGLIDSDGIRKKRERDIKRNRRYVRITSTSTGMVDDIKTLLRSLNVSYTVSKRKKALGGIIDGRRIIGRRDSFQIIFSDNALDGINSKRKGNVKKFPINCIEKKVLEIKEIPSDGYVYDLEMVGHHSFVANGVLVHNSATPYRDQGDDILIEACFGKKVCNITASQLIKENYLIKPDIYFIPMSNMRGKKFGTYATAYKEGIVNNTIRNNIIAKVAKQMMENDRVVLILCKQIKHGKILESLIPDSVFIHGSHSSKVRKKRLDEIRERKASVTIASTIFDEGINVRPLDTLILAGSGKSKTRALQRVGRILRTFPGKKEATVIDFMDNCKYMFAHSRARKSIYQTEPEFNIDELKIK